MKYFTPELFARTQNLADHAAVREWERASVAYTTTLTEVSRHLPRSLRRIIEEFHLHDADVLSMSRTGETLAITLQLEPPDNSLLVLTYSLVESPQIDHSALPSEYRAEQPAWLYDEIGLSEPGAAALLFTHHILLSNGWEVRLKFRKFKLSRPETLLPLPYAGGECESATPYSR
jgi:hypothetical protein